MAVHTIKKGLDLPITGGPTQEIDGAPLTARVALLAQDYQFMKPRMHAAVGDEVKRGQLLFEDRKTEGIRFTSPGAGTVVAINRGNRRAFQSLVIELTGGEREGLSVDDDFQAFGIRGWPLAIFNTRLPSVTRSIGPVIARIVFNSFARSEAVTAAS